MLFADLSAGEFRVVALTITTIIMGVVYWASRRMDAGEKKLDALNKELIELVGKEAKCQERLAALEELLKKATP